MKVLQINTVYGKGSTGKIARDIHDACTDKGIECITAYRYAEGKEIEDSVSVSSWLDCHIHNRLVRYTHLQGCFSYFKTAAFIRKAKKYSPDVIHLHNLHGNYINFKVLFNYIQKSKIPVVWTLHDCWTFTGQCAHFTIAGCDKWKTECNLCPQYKDTFGAIKKMYHLKKELFCGVSDITLVTPSKWLASKVRESFFKKYPIKVINNGIDTDIFRVTTSNFRERYGIDDNKKVLLGVAFGWGKRKGLDVFVELSKRLDSEKYQIVLVGTNDSVDRQLPENIISIHRTENQQELAEIYTAADLFVNPTREENFPTVNLESLACGTPVLTFKTGGSPECIDEHSGSVVDCDDIDAMEREIVRICTQKPYSSEACVKRAQMFNKKDRFEEYISLYREVFKG